MSEIKNELDTLPLRAMLAAAFITYLSAAPEDRRRHCLEVWTAQSGLQSRNCYINTRSQHNSARYLLRHVIYEITMKLMSVYFQANGVLCVYQNSTCVLFCPRRANS